MNLPRIFATIVLLSALCQSAAADVWRWVDANGDTHFVDTTRPIYTWRDEFGKVFFSDKPGHANAVSVKLVWHSTGSLYDAPQDEKPDSGRDRLLPGETEAEREQRMQAESYYCKRATDIYDSYVNAPRLYVTGADGEPEYLSDEEAEKTIAATKAQVDELCS